MTSRTESRRPVPFLASDTNRGWVILGAAVPVSVALPFILALLGVDATAVTFTTAILFLSWAFIGFFTAIITLAVFARSSPPELGEWLRRTAPPAGPGRIRYLLNGGGGGSWAVTGSVLAVVAVLVLSFDARFTSDLLVVSAGIAVVAGSWSMTVVSYAVRYARQYATVGGIDFPGDDEASFTDFIYLAVQVSTTFSTSDVTITSTASRRLVTVNSLISFGFNTVIVALLVSVLVGATG